MKKPFADNAFDTQFRLAMRRIASSVCVITSANGNTKHAMTATAVCSFSATPPSLLICINKYSGLHNLLSKKSPFCVNILHTSQQAIAMRCSRQPDDESRLELDKWGYHDSVPYLLEAQANVFCNFVDSLAYASHTAFIGEIHQIKLSDAVSPLIYLNGQYRQLPQ